MKKSKAELKSQHAAYARNWYKKNKGKKASANKNYQQGLQRVEMTLLRKLYKKHRKEGSKEAEKLIQFYAKHKDRNPMKK